jgi:hypothetical protein
VRRGVRRLGAATVVALAPLVVETAAAGAVGVTGRPDNGGVRYAYSETFTFPGSDVSCDVNGFVRVADDTGEIAVATFVTGDDAACGQAHVALELRTSERTVASGGSGPSIGTSVSDPGTFEQSRHSAEWEGCACQRSFTMEPK